MATLQKEKAALLVAASADASRLADQLARSAVALEAHRQGVSPGLVSMLPIDKAKVDVKTGVVSGIDDVIAGWRASAPEIFQKAPGTPPAGDPPAGTPPPPAAQPPANPPPTTTPPPTSFGPGLGQPAADKPAPTDVTKMNKADYEKAKADLRARVAKADRASADAARADLLQ